MIKNLSKKTKIVLITIHAIGLILIAFLVYRLVSVGEGYRESLSYTYQRSVGEISEYLGDIENALDKVDYVNTTTGQFAISSAIREAATGAKTAVTYLPFSQENSEKIENSLSLVSDFALYIERKSSAGESMTQEDYEAFEILAQHIETIKIEFENISEKISNDDVTIGETQEMIQKSLYIPDTPAFDDDLTGLEQLSALPLVVYDGVYSQHIEQKEALYLEDKEEISSDEAIKIASEFLNISESELSLVYESGSKIASYQFNSEDSSIKITKIGGEILYFKKTMAVDDSELSYEQALEKAVEYLNNAGYEDIKETYYVISDNICTINFVAVQDDVLMYLDLLTVSIELGEGGMMEFTSTGYLMNHIERTNLTPDINTEEASESISDKLSIEKVELAIIPSAGQNEILTYEFTTIDKSTNQEVLVYINATTGYEEQIYIVAEDETGVSIN